jgi:hypothetical protein
MACGLKVDGGECQSIVGCHRKALFRYSYSRNMRV